MGSCKFTQSGNQMRTGTPCAGHQHRTRSRGRDTGGVDEVRTVTVDEARRRLADLVAMVERRHDRVVLSRDGRSSAVLISPSELESLEETLDVLGDPSALPAVARAEAALASGGLDPAALADRIEHR